MGFAQRTHHLAPEGAYQVSGQGRTAGSRRKGHRPLRDRAARLRDLRNVSLAGIKAISEGKTRYTHPAGIPPLREAIAEDIGRRRGIKIHPDEVVVSPGGKPNLFFPTLALVEPGDEVIYPNPGFPTYEAMIGVAGGVPVPVPLLEENNFSFDLDAFDKLINKRTKLVILNSPSNPTAESSRTATWSTSPRRRRSSTAGSCRTRSMPGSPMTDCRCRPSHRSPA